LDATRCISYLTIELKSEVPQALRPQMGNWVFGCDVCQQACPWNERFADQAGEPAFANRVDRARIDLQEHQVMSAEDFSRLFHGSPIKRAKRRGYLRNTAVALGNSAQAGSLPVLARALQDKEPLVRGHAAWALGQIGGHAAAEILEAARSIETDLWVQTEIATALREFS
jgi:epoxyqueuosine reductase